ncbi:hypothetical protein HZC33_02360 [Candidatus Wolfebacteria bacterium]|nr:hypothetical protein [Candidatus Wolfebacteria bacterium]
MAILIEQEKQKTNWFSIIVAGSIILILVITAYYLFFVNPASIEIVVPSRLKLLKETGQIKLINPTEIIDSADFKSLKVQVAPITPDSAFNPNPFR